MSVPSSGEGSADGPGLSPPRGRLEILKDHYPGLGQMNNGQVDATLAEITAQVQASDAFKFRLYVEMIVGSCLVFLACGVASKTDYFWPALACLFPGYTIAWRARARSRLRRSIQAELERRFGRGDSDSTN